MWWQASKEVRDLLFVGDNRDEANDVAFHFKVEPVAARHSGLPDFFFAPAFVGVERRMVGVLSQKVESLINEPSNILGKLAVLFFELWTRDYRIHARPRLLLLEIIEIVVQFLFRSERWANAP